MARSTSFCAIFGATTLIIAISRRASLLPTVSIMCAAYRVSRRDWSISMRNSAIHCRVTPCSAMVLPNAVRDIARWQSDSSVRSASPIVRMQ